MTNYTMQPLLVICPRVVLIIHRLNRFGTPGQEGDRDNVCQAGPVSQFAVVKGYYFLPTQLTTCVVWLS